MASTEMVIMPAADYKAICDSTRAKTGGTELLKSGEVSTAIDGISGSGGDVIDIIERTATEIVVPDGCTKIGYYAFAFMPNVTSVYLPEGILSIENSAFFKQASLSSISIPASVDEILANAFARCTELTTVTFKGKPTYIESTGIFNDCPNLVTINVPWAEGEVDGAPWGADNATINYGYTGN